MKISFRKRGFHFYGIIGLLLMILTEINFIYKIEPFASWYFPLIWFGYIFLVDALVYKIKGNSLISSRFKTFLGLVLISAFFWYIFELTNISLNNWIYHGLENLVKRNSLKIFSILSFATVLPALFETAELMRAVHLFENSKLKRKHKITKGFLHGMMVLGFICILLPTILAAFTFPLIWLGFFFLLDPINYINGQPSVIKHIKDRKLTIPLSLLVAGIFMGFLWEFWNYWAVPKWTYSIPFIGFFKIFEMPILGYLGYFPFALELYAMYWFVRSLFVKKEKYLE